VEERIAYGDLPVPQQRLAEEVLGKEADVSPTSNPHVRIYLRRLRQRVATSYAGPGAADPLVLGVTCGPYRLSVECRRRADAPVTKAPRLKATPNMVVLITELAASGLDGELHLLPSLVSRSLVPYLLGQDGIVAIGPVPRQRITQPAWQSPVVRSSVADCLLDGVMTVGSAAPDGKRTVEIVIRLYDIETGGHVWSRSRRRPLHHGLPHGHRRPHFIRKITTDNLTGAARTILEANVLGASCARVCPTAMLCEGACVMLDLEKEPIQIGRLQRHATDHVAAHVIDVLHAPAEKNGRTVAILGAGPAGLGCAAELARLGYTVTVYDKKPAGGGLNTYGIAYYKMPPEVSLDEVRMIERLGVAFRYGVEIGRDVPAADLLATHDAVTQAKRLGAENATIIYRRGPGEMSAHPFEYGLAKTGGATFLFDTAAVEVVAEHGHVSGLRLAKTAVRDGRVAVVPGSEWVEPFDLVLKAVGQEKQASLLADLVPPPRKHRHRYHGVFAANHKLRRAVTALAIGNIGKGAKARMASPA
jgi:dihydropyrimidine dehydrogenase (NAD+) subunit PreT